MNSNDPKEMETHEQAAARLLAGLDERAKNKSGFVPVKIAVLCRITSTADREAGALRRATVEIYEQSEGAILPGEEDGQELWGGRLTPPVPRHEAANRPDALDNTSQVDRAGALQRMGD